MMQRTNLLFDLDGTLTDPGEGICNALAYVADKGFFHEPDRAVFKSLIGPPLWDSFMVRYGMSMERANEAVHAFREYYNHRGVYENYVYPGIETMLETLCAAGYRLYVATCKPTVTAVTVLRHFGLDKYFTDICGIEEEQAEATKTDVIAGLLAKHRISPDTAVMIGDRVGDLLGGQANGLPAVGVLWGYGGREELSGADLLAEDTLQLTQFLWKENA